MTRVSVDEGMLSARCGVNCSLCELSPVACPPRNWVRVLALGLCSPPQTTWLVFALLRFSFCHLHEMRLILFVEELGHHWDGLGQLSLFPGPSSSC